MIAEAFALVDFPILPLVKKTEHGKVQLFRRNPKLCTPSDFDYSPYFEIIKYPFVDFQHDEDYHLLPWHSSEHLAEDEVGLYVHKDELPNIKTVDEAFAELKEENHRELKSVDDQDN